MGTICSLATNFGCLLCLLLIICQQQNKGIGIQTLVTAFTVVLVELACGNTFWPTVLLCVLLTPHRWLFLSWIRGNEGGKRKQIDNINELKPGDRVAFTGRLYEHHAIVVSVHPKENEKGVFNVVEVGLKVPGNMLNRFIDAMICIKEHEFCMLRAGTLQVVQNGRVLPASQLVHNALGMVGHVVQYNPFTKNSKHYANVMETCGKVQEDIDRPGTLVTRIEDIKPGHQVAFDRILPYQHHGIVISVHPDEDVFNVVEVLGNVTQDKDSGEHVSGVGNMKHTFSDEEPGSVYVVEYDDGECLPDSEVIRNASRLDGTSVEYNLFPKNCEYYASQMKTGTGKSEQAEALSRKISSLRSGLLVFQGVYRHVMCPNTVTTIP